MINKTATFVQVGKDAVDVTPLGILQIAVQQGADVDKLAKLLEIHERWQASRALEAYNMAMVKFKQRSPKLFKNKHVQSGEDEYDYTTLDNVTETIIDALSAVGIIHKWRVSQSPEIAVTCVLTHRKGHCEETTLVGSPDTTGNKNSIQAIGSTVTYLQRYTLLAAMGMAAIGIDKDARGADREQKPRIQQGRLLECLGWIRDAQDLVTLQRSFVAACKEAQNVDDKDAETRYLKAKDQRKQALRANR